MRTLEEVADDVRNAVGVNDYSALIRYSDELKGFESLESFALSLTSLGGAELIQGEFADALEHFMRARALYIELGKSEREAKVLIDLGTIYGQTGNYPLALEHFQHAYDLYEKLDDRQAMAKVAINIGSVFSETGDEKQALQQYEHALEQCEEYDIREGMAALLGNIGTVYAKTTDYDKSMVFMQRSLKMHEELGDTSSISQTKNNIVSLLLLTDDLEEAVAVQDKQDAPEPGDKVNWMTYLSNQASIHWRQGDLEGAHTTFIKALEIASQIGQRNGQAYLHKKLRDLARERNDFDEYVEHNDEFTIITEEIRGKAATQSLAVQAKDREFREERRETEKQLAVLHSTLPKDIADRVARGETVSDQHENASVIFVDIVGFTSKSSEMDSNEVTKLLAEVFDQFDAICAKNNITKIKTIGDSYMAVGFDNVIDTAKAVLEMQASTFTWPDKSPLEYRIGIHCGPVTAGVIGTQRMQYDVWGDTVNVASRMESSGEPGSIHCSGTFADIVGSSALRAKDDKRIEVRERGTIDIKGKGPMKTFWLEGA